MGLLDKIKSLFSVSDEAFLKQNGVDQQSVAASLGKPSKINFVVPQELTSENVLTALQEYGRKEGYNLNADVDKHKGNILMSSIKNQTIKLHEEILKYYAKANQSPDAKLLNLQTLVNVFYISMGSAILAKLKKSNLITQGIFQKMLKKTGPAYFYREVAAMAGNKYGAEEVEALHKHVERAAFLLLLECDKLPDGREKVIECAKAMYMYGLCITLKLG